MAITAVAIPATTTTSGPLITSHTMPWRHHGAQGAVDTRGLMCYLVTMKVEPSMTWAGASSALRDMRSMRKLSG